MPYFLLDDGAYDHPKVAGLTDPAFRLWITAGCYVAKHMTDGYISPVTLRILHAKPKVCDELWAAGLWEKAAEGGYQMHDYLDYQKSREWHMDRRRSERDKKARQREKANKNPTDGRFV